MKHFRLSFLFTALCLGLAFWWGIESGKSLYNVMALVIILSILEVSLSFDNAVVNASVLKDMDEKWQRYFLTWGILIAVFGMRLVFPIAIVAVTSGLAMNTVVSLSLEDPEQYSTYLAESHIQVAAFGGIFLFLIFLNYFFQKDKTVHWLGPLERGLARVSTKVESISIIIALLLILVAQSMLPESDRGPALLYGLSGIVLYVIVDSLSKMLSPQAGEAVKRNGFMGFIYLQILDASFSFDGVLGAFAITNDIIIIMLGLGIGAMFVRSMTIFLVRQGTLEEYVFLEHGAHYAIGALGVIMLLSMTIHVPEIVTGLIGVAFIAWSLVSSIRHDKGVETND